jgi:hypothetical protein
MGPRLQIGPFVLYTVYRYLTTLEGARALGAGVALAPERIFLMGDCRFMYRSYKFVTVSPYGGFRTETATWIQKWFYNSRWGF